MVRIMIENILQSKSILLFTRYCVNCVVYEKWDETRGPIIVRWGIGRKEGRSISDIILAFLSKSWRKPLSRWSCTRGTWQDTSPVPSMCKYCSASVERIASRHLRNDPINNIFARKEEKLKTSESMPAWHSYQHGEITLSHLMRTGVQIPTCLNMTL
jgi:hypothetical protein